MPSFRRQLPGGRGYRTSEDAAVNQGESWGIRAGQIETEGGWFVGTGGDPSGQSYDVSVQFANRLNIVLLPERTKVVRITQCRISCTTAVAASTCKLALYFLASPLTGLLQQIPGTQVSFSTAAAGSLRSNLAAPIDLRPNLRLFLAWQSSAATALECHSGDVRNIPVFTQTNAPVSTQPNLKLLNMTKNYTIPPIAACYLSQQAQNLL